MKNKSKVLSYTCRCFLAIPAILMILHHCGMNEKQKLETNYCHQVAFSVSRDGIFS